MNYSTPKQFADYIRTKEYEPAPYPDDLEERLASVHKKYSEEIKRCGFNPQKKVYCNQYNVPRSDFCNRFKILRNAA